jgi:hypothetical protein
LPETAAGSPVASEAMAASSMLSRDAMPRLLARRSPDATSVTRADYSR